ncbi:hypothetical protein AFC81_07805 [Mycobacterium avium subsp. paratuberculosis]|uniref:Uncharacterized protein n=1 Tax=Mycolicibacterium paratuberculosis (strain ATCC BAA-968 / K-10) TaxID=262316 RepID=Q742H1_MYCPA|nr:hypothetical protein MAP_0864 [Mycobacterium avium subsp. paratuberculosis K-10]AGL37871.1 hypothetical protein MAP4_2996 [Mycobacterium avium subsp. paratuberculosis MAP4]OHW70786.1 hypothetical protein AFC81_07805 [Mycobacterium avium subsp. paratuberculosis]OHW72224.1 hypothetical protein AFC82_08790 [Mycobacterium avium subsp. paratuberculosis]OHW74545.1 hypothetical protein AFC79_06210 [Mycobacterium avium subsp. paratuberculosis]
MADIARLTLNVDPASVLLLGTGGTSRTRAAYENGVKTEANVQRGGVDVHRLTGVAVSVSGTGLDGAVVETSTPLENVPAGAIFRAEGAAEVSVRAEGRQGFGGGSPRGVLAVTVFVERLVPIGNANDVVRSSPQRRPAAGE